MRCPLASRRLSLLLALAGSVTGTRLVAQTPTLAGIAPQAFRQGMPTRTTLTGTNLGGVTSVQVGTLAGQNIRIVSGTELRFDMPIAAEASETAQVRVVAPAGTSNPLFVVRQQPRQFLPLLRNSLRASGEVYGVAFGDVDGDGDLDLAVCSGGHNASFTDLFVNDGTGEFAKDATGRIPQNLDHSTGIVLADLDGDRALDLIVVNSVYAGTVPPYSRILLNDRAGRFRDVSATHLPPAIVLSANTAAAGDVDGDHDNDVYFALRAGGGTLLLNDGTGHFTVSTGLPAGAQVVTHATFADIDGDRDLDLVRVTGRPTVYVNDGGGKFIDETSTRFPSAAHAEVSVAATDVDRDGDLDLAFATGIASSMWQRESLYLNDGAGVFRDVTATHMPATQSVSSDIAAGDLDGDGYPDLVIAVASGNTDVGGRNLVFINDGTGKFTDETLPRGPLDGDLNLAAALGDADQDGDLDLVIGGESGAALTKNAAWHAFAASPPVRGEPWVIELYGRAGHATSARPALPFLSLRALQPRVPVPPHGFLGIDPTLSFFLTTVTLSSPEGAGFVRVDIPDVVALLGLPVFVQALTMPTPQSDTWRLTGVVVDRIR